MYAQKHGITHAQKHRPWQARKRGSRESHKGSKEAEMGHRDMDRARKRTRVHTQEGINNESHFIF
eukprot:12981647-Alexandrium_andersonii.AAC.1